MEQDFDKFTNLYGSIHDTLISKYFFEPALLDLLGDVTGKSVLDLGCGEGYYSRLIKQKGASRVVGVDISPQMIDTAIRHEQDNPLGIEYVVSDIALFRRDVTFDVVCIMLVLPYARNEEHLANMFRVSFERLAPGGTLIAVTCVRPQLPRPVYSFTEVGVELIGTGIKNDDMSAVFRLRSTVKPELGVMSVNVTLFGVETYERCLKLSGFNRAEIKPLAVVPTDPSCLFDYKLFDNFSKSHLYQSLISLKPF